MSAQDMVVVLFYGLMNAVVYRGITGPRHVQTHVSLVVMALFTPVVAFRWSALGDVPAEAWALMGSFVAAQLANTAFHFAQPKGVHGRSPEVFVQTALALWCVSLRPRIDPSLWHRGSLGAFGFCFQFVFVTLSVMMTIYLAELTSHTGDEIDFVAYVPFSRSNAAFLAGAVGALAMTLFATFGDARYLAAGAIGFGVMRFALPVLAEATPRQKRSP